MLAPPRTSAPAAPADVLDVDRSDVTSHIQRTFAKPGYRPPLLPAVALEVMQLAQRTDVDFEKVVHLLERDPVMAARVLSIAQSPLYASRSPILSLRVAAIRMGLKTVRDIVMEAAVHLKVFRVPGYEEPMARIARHSTATAHVMRAVCRRTRVESEYAFLCGLLHDVGYAASLLALSEDPNLRRVAYDKVSPVLDEVHEEASGLLARLWKLPDPVQRVMARHHDLPKERPEPVSAALIVAEQLCWEAGAGVEPPPPDANPMTMVTPEPPVDGVDVNWIGLVDEARAALSMDELGLAAARAEAFGIVAQLPGAKS
ncbi:MAG TPA: HDOD domain-containing protein [Anaeromyxobacteraceae bacterium]|nr:HDOD domain-containing protein [Anaeromyxobacteraceae bacterium]